MPNGTLPIAGYLGDGQRTTSEFQGGIDELLAYVKSLKSEVDALSATVIKEAAVRGVGTDPDELVENSTLSSALSGVTLKSIYSASSPGVVSISFSALPVADQVTGIFCVRVNAYTDTNATFGNYWILMPIFDIAESSAGGYIDFSTFDIGVRYDSSTGAIKPWGTASGGADYRILEIARYKP